MNADDSDNQSKAHSEFSPRPDNLVSLYGGVLPSGRDWVDSILHYDVEEEKLAEIYEQGFTIMMIENGIIKE